MRTVTVSLKLLSPSGRNMEVTIAGDELDSSTLADLAENTSEYLEWRKSALMGDTLNGVTH